MMLQQTEAPISENGRKPLLIIVLTAIACGGILTLIQAARPIALIPIIALVLWICFLMDEKSFRKRWKGWAVFALVLLLSYGAGGRIWRAYTTEQLEQTPPSVPGYNIYVGFNLETNGSYSDTDMELLQSRYFGEYERNAEAAQQSMLQDAKLRISEARPVMPRLMLTKLKTLLGHDEGGVFYAMESLSNRQYSLGCVFSNIWYYLTCMLAVSGCLEIWRRGEKETILPCILFAIGLILAQLLVEVAARYHYVLIPILLLTAGFAFRSVWDRQTHEE